MTIFRVQHNKNYTTINNTICKDKRLSWKAKGIWLYAFSRPDDWEFNMQDLVNQSTDKTDSVTTGIKELENAGYLRRTRKRNVDGTLGNAEWFFHETPCEIKEIILKRENPNLDNPNLENPALLSTDVLLSTEPVVVVAGAQEEREKAGHGPLKYKTPKGEEKEISESDIYIHFTRLPQYGSVLFQAMAIARENAEGINNILQFLEGTCKNILNKKKIKEDKKQLEQIKNIPKPQQQQKNVLAGDLPCFKEIEELIKQRKEEFKKNKGLYYV